jgi:hypothetical protein
MNRRKNLRKNQQQLKKKKELNKSMKKKLSRWTSLETGRKKKKLSTFLYNDYMLITENVKR